MGRRSDHEIVSSQTKTIANLEGGSPPGCGSVTTGRLDDKEHRGVSEYRIALVRPGRCRYHESVYISRNTGSGPIRTLCNNESERERESANKPRAIYKTEYTSQIKKRGRGYSLVNGRNAASARARCRLYLLSRCRAHFRRHAIESNRSRRADAPVHGTQRLDFTDVKHNSDESRLKACLALTREP